MKRCANRAGSLVELMAAVALAAAGAAVAFRPDAAAASRGAAIQAAVLRTIATARATAIATGAPMRIEVVEGRAVRILPVSGAGLSPIPPEALDLPRDLVLAVSTAPMPAATWHLEFRGDGRIEAATETILEIRPLSAAGTEPTAAVRRIRILRTGIAVSLGDEL